ncbi:gluconokinase [Kitasatospora sp. DSM 101779]|uniref:gluconokinase n=1 Tax=Kitasatospora sp. DSM 101779 TaxID=2853165 RepID=UPI0021D82F1A|nr:gluconokinase [Kitasatospora sp. DSM 101779]MCU7821028.1 gluconokinase [Kitasatospora sp. DSM 101779]
MDAAPAPLVVVVMGVSSSGKSTLGAALAARLGVPFLEGDALHSPESRRKMATGHPLTDRDREPWLEALTERIRRWAADGRSGVVACSALKRAYRDRFRETGARIRFLQLDLDREVAARRIAARTDHFMPPSLLDSQYATLEPLGEDEPGTTVSAAGSPEETLAAATEALARSLARPDPDARLRSPSGDPRSSVEGDGPDPAAAPG